MRHRFVIGNAHLKQFIHKLNNNYHSTTNYPPNFMLKIIKSHNIPNKKSYEK